MIEYRRPVNTDAQSLAGLLLQSWFEAYASILPPGTLENEELSKLVERFERHIGDDQRIIFAAYDRGLPIGFILAGKLEERIVPGADGHIFSLYVLARYYRQGIGRRLLAMVAETWLSRGGQSLSVGVLEANTRARSFYEAAGAVFKGQGFFMWDGHKLPERFYLFQKLHSLIGKD